MGAEVSGAYKNVIAIAAGICNGLGQMVILLKSTQMERVKLVRIQSHWAKQGLSKWWYLSESSPAV